jgi:hypothetical protein
MQGYAEPNKPVAAPAAAPAKRGWFGRKAKNTPPAAAEPGLPTSAPHMGTTGPATGAAGVPHTGPNTAVPAATDAPVRDAATADAPTATAAAPEQRTGGAWNAAGENAV